MAGPDLFLGPRRHRSTISSDVFSYLFGDRIKYLRLAPEPKRVVIGIVTRKGKLSPALRIRALF
jgi:hypothetical protein